MATGHEPRARPDAASIHCRVLVRRPACVGDRWRLAWRTPRGSAGHAVSAMDAVAGPRLPPPQRLAALGAILCLYRSDAGSELEGWSQAVRIGCERALDSDGLRESLQFFDREGRCCWRLHLLPDTDFLAWEQLAAGVPEGSPMPELGLGERLWRRLARRLGGPGWRASVLRLHALPATPGAAAPLLAASLPVVSPCGMEIAGRIVRREGITGAAMFEACRARDAAVRPPRPDGVRQFDARCV